MQNCPNSTVRCLYQPREQEGVYNIGLIHVFKVVNIRRGPKNGLTPESLTAREFTD